MAFGPLATGLLKTGKRQAWTSKRKDNIDCIEALDRAGLGLNGTHRRILMVQTAAKEKLYIHYPGKEEAKRPWDFRPKLVTASGEELKDLNFADIWAGLYESVTRSSAEAGTDAAIATLFYRMAFMADHAVEATTVPFSSSDLPPNGKTWGPEVKLHLGAYHAYLPPLGTNAGLEVQVPKWPTVSLEGFLHYNDLLAWNEDCKYYHRDMHPARGRPKWGASGTGRVNNLLTHVSVIGAHKGDLSLADLLYKFSQLRGVAPAGKEEVLAICKPYVS